MSTDHTTEVESLVLALSSSELEQRELATARLRMGIPAEWVEPLCVLLPETTGRGFHEIIGALWPFASELDAVIPHVMERFPDFGRRNQQYLLRFLREVGPAIAPHLLVYIKTSEHERTQREMFRLLLGLDSPFVLASLGELFAICEEHSLIGMLLEEIERHRWPEAIPHLVAWLEEYWPQHGKSNQALLFHALRLLGVWGKEAALAVPFLRDLIGKERCHVDETAFGLLRGIGTPEAYLAALRCVAPPVYANEGHHEARYAELSRKRMQREAIALASFCPPEQALEALVGLFAHEHLYLEYMQEETACKQIAALLHEHFDEPERFAFVRLWLDIPSSHRMARFWCWLVSDWERDERDFLISYIRPHLRSWDREFKKGLLLSIPYRDVVFPLAL
jgi:hypothetical protein